MSRAERLTPLWGNFHNCHPSGFADRIVSSNAPLQHAPLLEVTGQVQIGNDRHDLLGFVEGNAECDMS